ncbi:MAG: DUF4286 family protein [Bacteroidales bacterium]|nr:DUF4286 family protein [Bacteroidales bacterium]
MYLYNTTFVVESSEIDWWQKWMRDQYLPLFASQVPSAAYEIFKIDGSGQQGESTFSCQWRCEQIGDLGMIGKCADTLQNSLMKLKNGTICCFSTMMKSIEI